jgi:tellurite resistance protein TehA-like permease
MNLLPWQFDGLGILATIMFVWNLVLFSLFTSIGVMRLLKYSSHTKKEIVSSMEETSYLAAPAIAFLALVAQVSLTCSTAWGYGFTVLAYVLWWIGLVWTVSLCSGTVVMLTKRHVHQKETLSPAMFLPIISIMTLGTTGGIIANYSAGITATMAVPIIIVSLLAIGYALFLSILYYAVLVHHLLSSGPPPPAKIPSLVITVGPLGQFATAIQVLGSAASTGHLFASYNEGTFITGPAGSALSVACELLALLIVGFAFLWITVAWYLIIERLVQRKLPFSMSWWSMIFPMGAYPTLPFQYLFAVNFKSRSFPLR